MTNYPDVTDSTDAPSTSPEVDDQTQSRDSCSIEVPYSPPFRQEKTNDLNECWPQ